MPDSDAVTDYHARKIFDVFKITKPGEWHADSPNAFVRGAGYKTNIFPPGFVVDFGVSIDEIYYVRLWNTKAPYDVPDQQLRFIYYYDKCLKNYLSWMQKHDGQAKVPIGLLTHSLLKSSRLKNISGTTCLSVSDLVIEK